MSRTAFVVAQEEFCGQRHHAVSNFRPPDT